ncbi:MAG TPA: efflux RND transporter permease subunit [Polyangia bacterium]|nr:efflux RND transporter permease subunit [Polyangia bacterium]
MSLTDVSIRNPVFAWMLMASTILFGVISVTRLGISQYPDVDYPNVTVSLSWPGASPSAIEREILEPIEESLSQVEGVQTMQAQARQGSARITCTFDLSRNVDLALQDVQAKVAQTQRSLPSDVPAATVSKSNPDDTPIVTVGVYGPFARQMLSDVARYQVQEKLQTVAGVGQITLNGYVDRNIRIWLDTDKMNERGVVVTDIIGSIGKEHVELPGGTLDTSQRQLNVRLLGEAIDLDALKKLVVRKVNDTPVYLEDVALVEDGFADVTTLAQLDGQPLQALGILKQRGTNAVAVAKAIRAKVAEIQASVPKGMKVEVLADTTIFISESVDEIELELGLALVLTALVCWLFLGSLSSTLNVVLAIPMSLLGTIAVIYFIGFTLNTFTLLGLSLAVGLVVDDAVMVMENIYRHAEMGKSKERAALDGTKEITTAALAATLAVIAIFLPVIFMKGIIGRFFFQFGITLSIAVLLSYFEAITLAPARCAQILTTSREGRSRIGRAVDAGFVELEHAYARALDFCLARPWKILFASVLLLAASMATVPFIKTEFIPSQDQSQLNVRIQTETGTSIAAAKPLIDRAEQILAKRPEVARVLSTLSGTSGSMTLTLVPPGQRKLSAQALSQELRKQLSKIAGIRASVQDPSQQGFGVSKGYPVDFTVRGPDWDTLVTAAMKLKDDLAKSGITTDLSTDYQIGAPEVQMTPDRRRASDLGISMMDLGNAVSTLIGGNVVGKFSTDGRRIDIRMRLMATQRTRPEDLGEIRMRTQTGDTVPMSLVVTTAEAASLQSINRLDRERAIGITGNVAAGHSQQEAMTYIDTLAKSLPSGYHVVASGQASQLAETTSGLFFALAVGILVAYMVLASQFNSFLHPVTVLTILPLALSGAALGLIASGKTLNIFSMIGVLLLMGIVKKNSILLVEYANRVREDEHLDARDAMQKAGPLRLRPILMTTVAIMMSAVPAILGLGPGTETRSPMAVVVLGGLTVSTVLSLLVVPCFYLVSDRLKSRRR